MSRRKFTDEGYPCEPVDLKPDGDVWAYVKSKGIAIYTESPNRKLCYLPWSLVRRALDDRTKAKTRRRSKAPV